MPVYLVAHIEITDPEAFGGYRQAAVRAIGESNGRILAAGPAATLLEGAAPSHNVIVEFPTESDALDFYASESYQRAIPLRRDVSVAQMLAVFPGLPLPG